ncbi:Uncharacterised protein [Raoultella planticola]|uniref:Uncharacterized protein n=1 Tax=Raoultella planticola TaxID=575 RepID=A0A485BXR8_RAOPL|nr:Uncharacterised protein [Raoultella planticola]
MRTALFYNSYKNFIAYSRYTRSGNPDHFTNVPSNIYTIYQAENRDKSLYLRRRNQRQIQLWHLV